MNWTISRGGFDEKEIPDRGNLFMIGNGYMGVRGTLDEFTKESLPAVNLAGIYDKVADGWREPLNAPNPFYTYLKFSGEILSPLTLPCESHEQTLDFRRGVMRRKTLWNIDGVSFELQSERFASMDNKHILAGRYTIKASADADIELFAGVDADVWDLHGPHYQKISWEYADGGILCRAETQNARQEVCVVRRNFLPCGGDFSESKLMGAQRFRLKLKAGVSQTLTSISCVFTSKDGSAPALMASELAKAFREDDYEKLLRESESVWDKIWAVSMTEIEGDQRAETAVNFSIYSLNIIAPREQEAGSVPARGLSGQTYKGAVFWDSEIFIIDYFLHTQPEIAKSMILYRIRNLGGALKKAEEYGYQGAFYPWESQEDGLDACSDYNVVDVFTGRPARTYFKDKQIHISSAVVYAIMKYLEYTDDFEILIDGGLETILECAKFYYSAAVAPLATGRWELRDILGPDEYHERVNNNAYTNRMALFAVESLFKALDILREKGQNELIDGMASEELLSELKAATEMLYMPEPDSEGLIEQFDGYFKLEDASLEEVRSRLIKPNEYWGGANGVASETQIIKQADVMTMLAMFSDEYPREVIEANWNYYEPRTEHGSSLSYCMYALSACKMRRPDLAYPLFMKSAEIDIKGGGKTWAGLVYIGGTHPAAAGGTWKTLIEGFAGMSVRDGNLSFNPSLPENWSKVRFRLRYRGENYLVTLGPCGTQILGNRLRQGESLATGCAGANP